MIDLLKKTLLTGVGLGLMTKDKVEEVAREVAKAANLSADKGQEFVEEAVARAKKGRQDLDEAVQKIVKESLRKANLPTRDDIAALSARLEKIERTLTAKPG